VTLGIVDGSMSFAYTPEVAAFYRFKKEILLNKISAPSDKHESYFKARAERLDWSLRKNSTLAVLAVLEWNDRHSDLRNCETSSSTELALNLTLKMEEEVSEYEEVLKEVPNSVRTFDESVPWYSRKDSSLLWKVGGEIADAGIFAIGVLEALGYDAGEILSVASLETNPIVNSAKKSLVWSKASKAELKAIHVLHNVSYQTEKLGIPIRSVMFYKVLQNEQHRSTALHTEHQLNGFSKTLRRSVGPLVWNSRENKFDVDSQIPAIAQSWVGPTVIETHVQPTEYETIGLSIINLMTNIPDIQSFTDLYPEPLTRQISIENWRNT